MPEETWDIALRKTGTKSSPAWTYTLPVAIGRELVKRDLWRAKVTLTENGILVSPYKATPPPLRVNSQSVELPF
jgi:hypothetical protein